MKCPNCGFESETKFCPMCGTAFPLQGEEQQSNPYLNQSKQQAQPPTGENQPVQQTPQPIGENQPERQAPPTGENQPEQQTPQPTGENQPVQQTPPNHRTYTQFNTAPSAPDSARYTAADFPEQKVKKDKKTWKIVLICIVAFVIIAGIAVSVLSPLLFDSPDVDYDLVYDDDDDFYNDYRVYDIGETASTTLGEVTLLDSIDCESIELGIDSDGSLLHVCRKYAFTYRITNNTDSDVKFNIYDVYLYDDYGEAQVLYDYDTEKLYEIPKGESKDITVYAVTATNEELKSVELDISFQPVGSSSYDDWFSVYYNIDLSSCTPDEAD